MTVYAIRCEYLKQPYNISKCGAPATKVIQERSRTWALCDEHAEPRQHPKDLHARLAAAASIVQAESGALRAGEKD